MGRACGVNERTGQWVWSWRESRLPHTPARCQRSWTSRVERPARWQLFTHQHVSGCWCLNSYTRFLRIDHVRLKWLYTSDIPVLSLISIISFHSTSQHAWSVVNMSFHSSYQRRTNKQTRVCRWFHSQKRLQWTTRLVLRPLSLSVHSDGLFKGLWDYSGQSTKKQEEPSPISSASRSQLLADKEAAKSEQWMRRKMKPYQGGGAARERTEESAKPLCISCVIKQQMAQRGQARLDLLSDSTPPPLSLHESRSFLLFPHCRIQLVISNPS